VSFGSGGLDGAWPEVGYSSFNNEWLVVWAQLSGNYNLLARRIDSAGALVGVQETVAGTATTERFPAMAIRPASNEFLIAYVFNVLGQRFSMDYTPPPVPTLLSPASGACINTTTPLLDWSDVVDTGGSGLQNYDVIVDDDPFFGSIDASTTTTASSWTGGTNTPPNDPTGLNQFKLDAVTIIPTGTTTSETGVVFKGDVSDVDLNPCALEVEVKPVTAAFDGAGTVVGGFVPSGSTAQTTVTGLTPGTSYHWRARTVDSVGATSGWQSFGGNSDVVVAGTDVTVSAAPNNPPAAPSGLGQFKLDAATAIALGGTTNETGVVLKATVSDPDGDSVMIEVEVKPVGSVFTGVASGSSALVPSGSTAQATVGGLVSVTSYHWQARAVDSMGNTSAWVDFGSNGDAPPPAGTDFTVNTASNTPPALPTGPGQFRSDGVTAIAAGGTTNESTVVFKATVSDPDGGTVQLEVEVVLSAAAFANSPTATSAAVASGSQATVTVAGLAPAAYKWQFRAIDPSGATSAWTPFPPGDPDFTVIVNTPPAAPAGLNQFRMDGVTVIAVGGTTPEAAVIMRGTISDPDGDTVRMQIECVTSATPFSGTPTQSGSLVASGSTQDVSFPIPAPGDYHWRARTVDSNGAASAWVLFNVAAIHFTRVPNSAPSAPMATQHDGAGGPLAPVGATITQPEIEFRSTITDPDPGDTVRLEVEIKPVNTGFTNVPTASSSLVASGSTAVLVVSSGITAGPNHWQYRLVDNNGNASAWQSFGGNLDPSDTDFVWIGPRGLGGSRGHTTCFGGAGGGARLWWVLVPALLALAAIRRR
jgi:hypothetical protein